MSDNKLLHSDAKSLGYEPIKTFQDIRFGKVRLYRNPADDTYFTRTERIFQSEDKANTMTSLLQRRLENPNLYYVSLSNHFNKEIKQFCSKFHKVSLLMPFPEEDLAKEIKTRMMYSQPFSNKELTFLLYDLVNGMSHLQQLGFVHGCLRPEFVARTTTGYAVMEDPFLNQFRVLDLRSRVDWYLSPQAYVAALTGRPSGRDFSINKADVFSAGLILLVAGLQMKVGDIYGKRELRGGILKHYIELFQKMYPDNNLLVSTVKKMLEISEKSRPDFIEIHEKLPSYKMVKEYFETNPGAEFSNKNSKEVELEMEDQQGESVRPQPESDQRQKGLGRRSHKGELHLRSMSRKGLGGLNVDQIHQNSIQKYRKQAASPETLRGAEMDEGFNLPNQYDPEKHSLNQLSSQQGMDQANQLQQAQYPEPAQQIESGQRRDPCGSNQTQVRNYRQQRPLDRRIDPFIRQEDINRLAQENKENLMGYSNSQQYVMNQNGDIKNAKQAFREEMDPYLQNYLKPRQRRRRATQKPQNRFNHQNQMNRRPQHQPKAQYDQRNQLLREVEQMAQIPQRIDYGRFQRPPAPKKAQQVSPQKRDAGSSFDKAAHNTYYPNTPITQFGNLHGFDQGLGQQEQSGVVTTAFGGRIVENLQIKSNKARKSQNEVKEWDEKNQKGFDRIEYLSPVKPSQSNRSDLNYQTNQFERVNSVGSRLSDRKSTKGAERTRVQPAPPALNKRMSSAVSPDPRGINSPAQKGFDIHFQKEHPERPSTSVQRKRLATPRSQAQTPVHYLGENIQATGLQNRRLSSTKSKIYEQPQGPMNNLEENRTNLAPRNNYYSERVNQLERSAGQRSSSRVCSDTEIMIQNAADAQDYSVNKRESSKPKESGITSIRSTKNLAPPTPHHQSMKAIEHEKRESLIPSHQNEPLRTPIQPRRGSGIEKPQNLHETSSKKIWRRGNERTRLTTQSVSKPSLPATQYESYYTSRGKRTQSKTPQYNRQNQRYSSLSPLPIPPKTSSKGLRTEQLNPIDVTPSNQHPKILESRSQSSQQIHPKNISGTSNQQLMITPDHKDLRQIFVSSSSKKGFNNEASSVNPSGESLASGSGFKAPLRHQGGKIEKSNETEGSQKLYYERLSKRTKTSHPKGYETRRKTESKQVDHPGSMSHKMGQPTPQTHRGLKSKKVELGSKFKTPSTAGTQNKGLGGKSSVSSNVKTSDYDNTAKGGWMKKGDIMVTPTGLKLKRILEQGTTVSSQGVPVNFQEIKWIPFEDQGVRLRNQESRLYKPVYSQLSLDKSNQNTSVSRVQLPKDKLDTIGKEIDQMLSKAVVSQQLAVSKMKNKPPAAQPETTYRDHKPTDLRERVDTKLPDAPKNRKDQGEKSLTPRTPINHNNRGSRRKIEEAISRRYSARNKDSQRKSQARKEDPLTPIPTNSVKKGLEVRISSQPRRSSRSVCRLDDPSNPFYKEYLKIRSRSASRDLTKTKQNTLPKNRTSLHPQEDRTSSKKTANSQALNTIFGSRRCSSVANIPRPGSNLMFRKGGSRQIIDKEKKRSPAANHQKQSLTPTRAARNVSPVETAVGFVDKVPKVPRPTGHNRLIENKQTSNVTPLKRTDRLNHQTPTTKTRVRFKKNQKRKQEPERSPSAASIGSTKLNEGLVLDLQVPPYEKLSAEKKEIIPQKKSDSATRTHLKTKTGLRASLQKHIVKKQNNIQRGVKGRNRASQAGFEPPRTLNRYSRKQSTRKVEKDPYQFSSGKKKHPRKTHTERIQPTEIESTSPNGKNHPQIFNSDSSQDQERESLRKPRNPIDDILPAIVIETPYSPTSVRKSVHSRTHQRPPRHQSSSKKSQGERMVSINLNRELAFNRKSEGLSEDGDIESRTIGALSSIGQSPSPIKRGKGPEMSSNGYLPVADERNFNDHQRNIRSNNHPIYTKPPNSSQMGYEYKPIDLIKNEQ